MSAAYAEALFTDCFLDIEGIKAPTWWWLRYGQNEIYSLGLNKKNLL